eukprot:m.3569 g.3569  ORF g.3569 m.3569 type:complete len:331 (+) comp3622_c0_seq1:685-1677(+)
MCFRVFFASRSLCDNEDDVLFYKTIEKDCVKLSDHSVFLSHNDQRLFMLDLRDKEENGEDDGIIAKSTVLFPPLRPDFGVSSACRTSCCDPFRLLCCVRLSPEKHAMNFVKIVRVLRDRGVLSRFNITPTLCGATSDDAYAQVVKDSLRQVCGEDGCEIIDGFVSPQRLVQLFCESIVNIHPSRHDAYGMTIVEAAACGTISLVSNDGTVGAVQLFRSFCDSNTAIISRSGKKCGKKRDEGDDRCGFECEDDEDVSTLSIHDLVLLNDIEDDQACATQIEKVIAALNAAHLTRDALRSKKKIVKAATSWTTAQYAQALSSLLSHSQLETK